MQGLSNLLHRPSRVYVCIQFILFNITSMRKIAFFLYNWLYLTEKNNTYKKNIQESNSLLIHNK